MGQDGMGWGRPFGAFAPGWRCGRTDPGHGARRCLCLQLKCSTPSVLRRRCAVLRQLLVSSYCAALGISSSHRGHSLHHVSPYLLPLTTTSAHQPTNQPTNQHKQRPKPSRQAGREKGWKKFSTTAVDGPRAKAKQASAPDRRTPVEGRRAPYSSAQPVLAAPQNVRQSVRIQGAAAGERVVFLCPFFAAGGWLDDDEELVCSRSDACCRRTHMSACVSDC